MASSARTKKARPLLICVIILLVLICGFAAYGALLPTLTHREIIQYLPYEPQKRDIRTFRNFGGTVSVMRSENLTVEQAGYVRELYVSTSDEVKKDDKILLMDDGTLMRSKIDGVVNQVRVSVGSYVRARMTMVQICDLVNLQITMNVDEYDVTDIHLGMPCTVMIISLDQTFEASVSHINKVSTGSGNVAYYSVSIDFKAPKEILPGMQATITIEDQYIKDALTIPVEAVSFDEEEQPFVFVETSENTYDVRKVQLGENDGIYVQITDGLQENERAYVQKKTVEEAEPLSFEDICRKLLPTRTEIRPGERTRGERNGRMQDNMPFPEGMPIPGGGTVPDGMSIPNGGIVPEGISIPDSSVLPEGMSIPDGSALPEGMSTHDGGTMPEGMPIPDSSALPEGMPIPDGSALPEGVSIPGSGTAPEGIRFPEEIPGDASLPERTPVQSDTDKSGNKPIPGFRAPAAGSSAPSTSPKPPDRESPAKKRTSDRPSD